MKDGFDVIAPAGMADGRRQMATICNLQSAICNPHAFGHIERVEVFPWQ
ncbi:MAG: hypothetical protein AAB198_05025 [Actinomycetota bacterium]